MYVELHCHSNFSLLDGASTVEQLVEAAHNAGMGGLALTDHNGLYAAPQFFRAAKEAGIKPVIGAELTLEGSFHVTLLVENSAGYTNLSRLITKAHLAGSKGDPRLTFADLAERSEGLICLSGCSKGEIPSLLLREKRMKPFGQRKNIVPCLVPIISLSSCSTISIRKIASFANSLLNWRKDSGFARSQPIMSITA